MLTHRITLAAILFLASGATNAEAQFCYPGRCGYYRAPFVHRPYSYMYRPYAFWRHPPAFAHYPTPSVTGHRERNGVPGGMSNPYGDGATSNGSQGQNNGSRQAMASPSTESHHHRYVPGGLSNPYTAGPSGGSNAQGAGAGVQRNSESGGGNPSGQSRNTENNANEGGNYRTDGQRVGDSGGQPQSGGYSANGPANGAFKYSCTINDSEEDAGAGCTRTSAAMKHSGDRCSCHGEWGTVD